MTAKMLRMPVADKPIATSRSIRTKVSPRRTTFLTLDYPELAGPDELDQGPTQQKAECPQACEYQAFPRSGNAPSTGGHHLRPAVERPASASSSGTGARRSGWVRL